MATVAATAARHASLFTPPTAQHQHFRRQHRIVAVSRQQQLRRRLPATSLRAFNFGKGDVKDGESESAQQQSSLPTAVAEAAAAAVATVVEPLPDHFDLDTSILLAGQGLAPYLFVFSLTSA